MIESKFKIADNERFHSFSYLRNNCNYLTSTDQVSAQGNSRCCCKEMPSTTEWNHNIFYPHYTVINKVVFMPETHAFHASVCCVKRAHLLQACKHMLCELDRVKCRGRILHERAFLKTTFEWSVGKNNPENSPAVDSVFLQQHLLLKILLGNQ